MTISAKVIADSYTIENDDEHIRLTTFELEFPRYIMAQFNTHRLFSRNAASSRAIPVKRMIDLVNADPVIPTFWGTNQSGMQASKECNNPVTFFYPWTDDDLDVVWQEDTHYREDAWTEAKDRAVHIAGAFSEAGYHKEIVNRLLEPFAHIKVVMSATELANFFWLRLHSDAQPEIQELARCIKDAMDNSDPVLLYPGDYHVPYYEDGHLIYEGQEDWDDLVESALKISASCCAQVSYRRTDDSPEKADKIYSMLVDSEKFHASPFEHQATPIDPDQGFVDGVTAMDRHGYFWSGNFRGFIQQRQLMANNAQW